MVLDAAGVAAADKMAILSALGPTCDDIVAGGTGCPGRTVIALTATNTLVSFDSKTPRRCRRRSRSPGWRRARSWLGSPSGPANGKLYGLGSGSRLYEINRDHGRGHRDRRGALRPGAGRHHLRVRLQPHGRSHPGGQRHRARTCACTRTWARWSTSTPTPPEPDRHQPDPARRSGGGLLHGQRCRRDQDHPLRHRRHQQQTGSPGRPDGTPSPNGGSADRHRRPGRRSRGRAGFDIAPGSDVAYAAFAWAAPPAFTR